MHDALSRNARLAGGGLMLLAVAVLAGCSGGSGAATQEIPGRGTGSGGSSYNGPPPATADVQSFKINFYDNIRSPSRCGSCHGVEGGQAPMFARSDDVNLAYAAANTVVTLTSPKDSVMVRKVAGGHNCWLASPLACAEILETWIANWAGALASSGDRRIELKPPRLRDPGKSKSLPADPWLFSSTVYPLLHQHCSSCHSSSSALKQQPFFAEGPPSDSSAVATAYEAAKARISLDDPQASRFVVRLGSEFHNCWTSSCASDAAAMEDAIEAFAAGVPETQINPALVTSKATTLYEGTMAAGGSRYEANVIALYEFNTGEECTTITGGCSIAYDTSGVDPAMDLTLSGNVEWFGGWGLSFAGGKAQATTMASRKLRTMISATGEYSIEAWVAPGNVVQEDMRIVSYSGGATVRNFTLGQTMSSYDFFNRSSYTNENGAPRLSTPDAAEVLQATLQHVVATFDPVEGRKIYVNGVLVSMPDPVPGGALSDWDDTFAFVLGNEVSGDRNWVGVIRLVAIHNRALTPAQIRQNFEAGVGQKYFLMFSVEHLTNVNDSYVVFEASQYDTYGYLFRKPFFISLDGDAQPSGIDLRGMRIGLNGAEIPVGQTYARLATQISGDLYTPGVGQVLTTLGAVLPVEKGPKYDEFFLTFDRLGANAYNRPPPVTPPAPAPQDLPPASDIGVRTFDEINATMSVITGVSQMHPNVNATFTRVRQSLPAVETIEAFLASHQVAIAQLAIEYCNAMIDNVSLREDKFTGFPFTAKVEDAWPGPGAVENLFIEPLLDMVFGSKPLATHPDRAAVKTELTQLVHGIPDAIDPPRPGLARGGGDERRTRTIAKAVCAAVLGSAAMLVQ